MHVCVCIFLKAESLTNQLMSRLTCTMQAIMVKEKVCKGFPHVVYQLLLSKKRQNKLVKNNQNFLSHEEKVRYFCLRGMLVNFLAKRQMRRLTPLSCRQTKYEATDSSRLTQHNIASHRNWKRLAWQQNPPTTTFKSH